MKKAISILLMLFFALFALVGCGDNNKPINSQTIESNQTSTSETSEMNSLVSDYEAETISSVPSKVEAKNQRKVFQEKLLLDCTDEEIVNAILELGWTAEKPQPVIPYYDFPIAQKKDYFISFQAATPESELMWINIIKNTAQKSIIVLLADDTEYSTKKINKRKQYHLEDGTLNDIPSANEVKSNDFVWTMIY